MAREKETITFCYILQCEGKPMWAVKNEKTNRIVKCCDEHLAYTLRQSGLPAYINKFEEKEETKEFKHQK